MKFLSPTINLWMVESDFQKFCFHISYYQNEKLVFIESDKSYPVAELGQNEKKIRIYFLHYASKEDAEHKWAERIKRINYDNLYVIATDTGMSEADILRWKEMKCNNIVIFTAKEYDNINYTFKLKGRTKDEEVLGKYLNDFSGNDCGIRYVDSVFDYAAFLNKRT